MIDSDEKRIELVEHLAELRTRLIRSFIYLLIGTIIAWCFYDELFSLLIRPMMQALKGTKFLLTGFPEAFMIRMQICIVAGLIVASPLLSLEMWRFIAPGLMPDERRPLMLIAPLASILFASGVVLCYSILPAAFNWFASYVPNGAELRPSVQASVLFTIKMLFAFGVVFELPVVLMLLAKVGIVTSKMLKENWRIAVVVISIVAAIATPSNDAFSMLMMAVPVVLLYFVSIFLVWVVESKFSPRDIFYRFRKKNRYGRR